MVGRLTPRELAARDAPPKRLPTPTPTELSYNPTADEFEFWTINPVTRWVAKAYAAGIEANVKAWAELLGQDKTPEELMRAKLEYLTRSDAYAAFLQTTHADYLKTNDEKEWKEIYG